MQFPEWEPIYTEILDDLGFDREEDERSVRLLKAVTMNSDLVDEDILEDIIGRDVTVFGDGPNLLEDIANNRHIGTVICSGSAVNKVISAGILPEIVVTDLDGDIESQLNASRMGAVTLIHAHGDNTDLIQRYAQEFRGPVILTTQSVPENTVSDYGGFTDGDRAVCLARHFGARRILLLGFDFINPSEKTDSDPIIKKRKLKWAEKIIFDHNAAGTEILTPYKSI
jgi:uncharacterized Rossmann fold enzyme